MFRQSGFPESMGFVDPVFVSFGRRNPRNGPGLAGTKKVQIANYDIEYFMDEKSILRLLTSDNDLTNITEKDHTARQMGIKAVPMFIVANQYAVSGAQSTGFWQNVVTDIQNSIS